MAGVARATRFRFVSGFCGGDINFMMQKDMKPPSADAVLCWIPAFAGMTFVGGGDGENWGGGLYITCSSKEA